MKEKASRDHEGEENVKADGDSEVGKAEVHGDPTPQIRVGLGSVVESDDAHRFERERSLSVGNACFP